MSKCQCEKCILTRNIAKDVKFEDIPTFIAVFMLEKNLTDDQGYRALQAALEKFQDLKDMGALKKMFLEAGLTVENPKIH